MTEFTSEFIKAEKYVNHIIINHDLTTRTEILLATSYTKALDHIERLQREIKYCHKLIDKVLDNRNVGMCTSDSMLSFRLNELVNYYEDALDHIERQAKRIEELEQDKTFFQELVNRWSNRYYKVTKELRQRIAELEQERNNKCSDCCYVNPILDFWKNDTEYDDLPQPPKDGE